MKRQHSRFVNIHIGRALPLCVVTQVAGCGGGFQRNPRFCDENHRTLDGNDSEFRTACW